jgi:LEA14-like dessication related protein
MKTYLFPLLLGLILSVFLGLWNSCKSPPPPRETPVEAPRYSLRYERVEAERIDRVSLYYFLQGENAEIRDWRILLNGEDLTFAGGGGAVLLSREGGVLKLEMDLPELPPKAIEDFDEYQAELRVIIAGSPETVLSAQAVFPRIREPEFTITSIAILKDELVNTRFKVDLRIDNPNIFPVKLSSFGYELYGKGRYWAEGKERNVLDVPARGCAEAKLFLMMNFIDMKRDLLDEVIALGNVPYRFFGETLVSTGVPLLPSFKMDFDQSGVSVVIK